MEKSKINNKPNINNDNNLNLIDEYNNLSDEIEKITKDIEYFNKKISSKEEELNELTNTYSKLDKERKGLNTELNQFDQILNDGNLKLVNMKFNLENALNAIPLTPIDGISEIKSKISKLTTIITKPNEIHNESSNKQKKDLLLKINYQGNIMNFITPDDDLYTFDDLVKELKGFLNYKHNQIIIKDDNNLVWPRNYSVKHVINSQENQQITIYLTKDFQIIDEEEDPNEMINETEDELLTTKNDIQRVLKTYAYENGATEDFIDLNDESNKEDLLKSFKKRMEKGFFSNKDDLSDIEDDENQEKVKNIDQQEQEVLFEIEKTFGKVILSLIFYLIWVILIISFLNKKALLFEKSTLTKSIDEMLLNFSFPSETVLSNGREISDPVHFNSVNTTLFKTSIKLKNAFSFSQVWEWLGKVLFYELGFYSIEYRLNGRFQLIGPVRILQLQSKKEENCNPLSNDINKEELFCYGKTISTYGDKGNFNYFKENAKYNAVVKNFLKTCNFDIDKVDNYSSGDAKFMDDIDSFKWLNPFVTLSDKLNNNEVNNFLNEFFEALKKFDHDEKAKSSDSNYCYILTGFFRRKIDYAHLIDGKTSSYSPNNGFYIDFPITNGFQHDGFYMEEKLKFLDKFWTGINTRLLSISFNALLPSSKSIDIINYTFYIEQGVTNALKVSYKSHIYSMYINLYPFLPNDKVKNFYTKLKNELINIDLKQFQFTSEEIAKLQKYLIDLDLNTKLELLTSNNFFSDNIVEIIYLLFIFFYSSFNIFFDLLQLYKEPNKFNFKGMYNFYFVLSTNIIMLITFVSRIITVFVQYNIVKNLNNNYFEDFFPTTYFLMNFDLFINYLELSMILLLVLNLFNKFYIEFFGRIFKVFADSLISLLSFSWFYLLVIVSFSNSFSIMYGVNIKDFNDFITTLSTLISFGIEKDKLILDVLNNNNEILTKMLLVAFIFMINFLMLSTPFMIFYENYKRIVKKNELPLLKYSIIWYGIKYFSQNIYHKIFKFIKRIFMPKKGKII